MTKNESSRNRVWDEMRDLDQAYYWTLATCFQGERLTRTYSWRHAPSTPRHFITTTTLMAEEQFFLNAVGKMHRYLTKIQKDQHLFTFIQPARPSIDEFCQLVKREDKLLVRNKRVHDDEYLGTNQKEPEFSDVPSQGNGPEVKVSPSVTVIKDGRILLGGVLDVQSTIECANRLAAILREQQHKCWDGENKSVGANPYGPSKYPDHLVSP